MVSFSIFFQQTLDLLSSTWYTKVREFEDVIFMYLADNIRYLRKNRHMSQEDLADLLGYKSFTTIQRWEDGSSKPRINVLQQLCDVFAVDLNDLTGTDLTQGIPARSKTVGKIPVLGKVAAGIPMEAVENIIDFEEIPAEWEKSGSYFALQIKGSSMAPRIMEGDVVIVRKQATAENGDIAIVLVGNSEATCKKVKISEKGISLLPLNQAYEPMFYTTDEIQSLPVTILGKVTELRGKF